MSEERLIEIGNEQLIKYYNRLKSSLEALTHKDVPEKVRDAAQWTLDNLESGKNSFDRSDEDADKTANFYKELLHISHILGFLRLAAHQRSPHQTSFQNQGWFARLVRGIFPGLFVLEKQQPDLTKQLEQIEQLIQSCYEPFIKALPEWPKELFPKFMDPEKILAVFFQDEFLARPDPPVPVLIVPNYLEGSAPEEWMGVGHEIGHHIYRQIPYLREELEVTVSKVLQDSGFGDEQERLWFNYLEETFADLVGVLTLGAAFVYEQHVIIRNYVKDDELRGGGNADLTHPIPLLRGRMGVYIYEKLLDKPLDNDRQDDLDTLTKEWDEVTNQAKTLHNPHTQLPESLESEGSLELDKTIVVMKEVVNTILSTQLKSLNCHTIGELLNFSNEESYRLSAMKSAGNNKSSNSNIRILVAALRLADQRATKDLKVVP